MSMPVIASSENPISRNQSVSDLIESIALMETGLSHIVNAEGEKIQKVVKHDQDVDVPIEDIIRVNDSAQKMINSVARLEMILQSKLELSSELDQNGTIPEEGYGSLMSYTGPINISTTATGLPNNAALMANQYTIQTVDINGVTDTITMPSISISSYSVARNATLTSISAFLEMENITTTSSNAQIVARLYKAAPNSNSFSPVDNAMVRLNPIIPSGTSGNFNVSGITENINATIQANEKLLLVFYAEATTSLAFGGYAGASINLQ